MEKVIKINCTSDNYLNLSDMIPFEDNPREITDSGFKKLKKSITTLGIFKPFLIWRSGNKILGGNQRNLVLTRLIEEEGYTLEGPLPVTYIDVDEVTARTIVLRDNQSDGEWAYELLAEYMNDLQEKGGDLTLTGFTDKEMTDLKKLAQSPDDLRKDLEDMAGDTSVDEMLKRKFGISFKIPEEDWDLYQDAIYYAKKQTGTEDVWENLKFLLKLNEEKYGHKSPETILKKAAQDDLNDIGSGVDFDPDEILNSNAEE